MTEIKKIVVTGPESTGKSTLSQMLADELQTVWVPEFARGYLENLGRDYTEADLLEIAKGQIALEDAILTDARQYLICDTDLYVIKVWSEVKYNRCHPWILEQIAQRKYDMYLLAYIDTPWQDDPLREHPLPHERSYLYNTYRGIVIQSGIPWVDVRGNEDERLLTSIKAIRLL